MKLARTSRTTAEWIDIGFVPVILLVLVVALAVLSPYFFSPRNFTEILLQAAILGIVSVGTTFVIIGGDLDLSIGANVALSGVVCGLAMNASHNNIPIGIAAGLGCGVLIGAINGLISTRLHVPAFVATLGMLVIGQGIALTLTNGASISNLPDAFGALANGKVLGLPGLVWWMFLTFIAGYLLLHRTVYGIRTFAVGGNREAARLAGIRVDTVRVANFVVSGLTGGIGGVLLAARVQAAQPTGGEIFTLYATAAVILGGTSLYGGRGSILRTLLGVALIALLENGLELLGVPYSNQQIAVGVVFIIAASSELIRRR
ncbi:MAG TPA: ABC transporter permease [Candidatus Lustribacter sp.]